MSFTYTWYGHGTHGVETGGYKVLIDPFFTDNPTASTTAEKVEADFIVVSHGHGDHIADAIEIAQRTGAISIAGVSGTAGAYLAEMIRRELRKPVLLVVDATKTAEARLAEIECFAGEEEVPAVHFPGYNLSPFKFMSYPNETAARRIRAL